MKKAQELLRRENLRSNDSGEVKTALGLAAKGKKKEKGSVAEQAGGNNRKRSAGCP